MYIRGALKIGLVAPVKPFHPYSVDDLAPLLDLHYLRIPPWLWFSSSTPARSSRENLAISECKNPNALAGPVAASYGRVSLAIIVAASGTGVFGYGHVARIR